MDSTRSFLRLWLGFTILILAYALLDLWMHPWLRQESNFTMRPDLAQVGDLWHWGGRLLKEDAVSLLIANAIIVAGAMAMVISGLVRMAKRLPSRPRRDEDAPATREEEATIAYVGTPSVPPPGL